MKPFLLAGATALALALLPAPAFAKGKVTVKTVEYGGWKNNLKLSNGVVEVIVTLDVGPRVISYSLAGGKNVLKEYSDQLGKSGEKDWQIRGGHRLWTAPEDLTRTYAPDNSPVAHKVLEDGTVRFTQPADKEYGIQKEIDLTLAQEGGAVKLVHRITNVGTKTTSLAPWALTVMAPGGVEYIPLPPKKPHPGPPAKAKSPKDYAPNQKLILWPYFDFKDPRWTFGTKYLTLKQDAKRGPTKVGLSHRRGWVAYHVGGSLFVKWVEHKAKENYPDRGCNFETFTNEDMLEVESLGPLVDLKKGEKTEHAETWELHKLTAEIKDEADIDRHVLPLVGKKKKKK